MSDILEQINRAKDGGARSYYGMNLHLTPNDVLLIRQNYPLADMKKCKRGLWDVIIKF